MDSPLKVYQTITHLINRDAVVVYKHVIRVEALPDGSHLIILPNGLRSVLPAGTIFEYQI